VRVKIQGVEVRGLLIEDFKLYTNDPRHPSVTLRLTANATPLPDYVKRIKNAKINQGEQLGSFKVWPAAKPEVSIGRNERTNISLRIRPDFEGAVELKLGSNNFEQAKYKLRREDSRSYWLDIETEPVSDAGVRNIAIELQSVSPKVENFSVNLVLNILDDSLLFTPAIVDCGEIPLSSLKQFPTRVGRAGVRKLAGTFRIKSVSSTLNFLKPEVQAMVEGSNYLIRVNTEVNNLPQAGAYQGKLIVETDDPQKPRLEIPIKITLTNK
jgi:hypothetical protein